MEYSFIIAVIPVILVVAFLVWIAKKITDGERLDMKEGVLGVVILMVAVLIMVPMVSSTQVYTWDEDTGELVIQQNISGGSYAWDTYDSQIRSIVIKPGVTQIGNSAFDGATNLEYLSIPDSVTDIGNNAFGVTFVDPFGDPVTISDLIGYEYAGLGDGELYQADDSIFRYGSDGTSITGLSNDATSAIYIVIPKSHDEKSIVSIANSAFASTSIVKVLSQRSNVTMIGDNAFGQCASLEIVELPGSITTLPYRIFYQTSSLADVVIPEGVTAILNQAFNRATALTSIELPSTVSSIGDNAFAYCSSLESISFPGSIDSIGSWAFAQCTGIASVSFASGFSPSNLNADAFLSWTFYESDGTTTIDKTDASALAGKTFQGTASALVEVAPGLLTLTPQQIQQVHLHDTELQDLKDQISIEPLPLQPSLQGQELTA